MRELVLTPRFERSFRRVVGKHPAVRAQIEATLRRMTADINDPRLKTHHLSGHLAGLHACTVNYDCRIVFSKQKRPKTDAEVLILVNIGTHDEVY
jgi:mRNA-degrading endonuclease YafQ of YafQ-DinJ toxin-antitoxin module